MDQRTPDTPDETTDAPAAPEDPGRDPVGLDPPRDVFSAAGTLPEHGSFDPGSGPNHPHTAVQGPPPGGEEPAAPDDDAV